MIADWLELTVASLAAWRIASLFVREDGPLDIFRGIRKGCRAGEFSPALMDVERLTDKEAQEVMQMADVPLGFMGSLLSCMWCCSVWTAAVVVLLWGLAPQTWLIWWIFAVSAIAIVVDGLVGSMDRRDR